MTNYRLTNKAVEDLSKIWEYTFEIWSEDQADFYYATLINHCQKISKDPSLGKKYNGIYENQYGFKVNKHIIFYRPIKNEYIEITRILHEQMDLKKRLLDK